MRIGLFTDTYEPDINGVVTSIVTLKNALEEAGHTVFVITNQPSIINTSYENQVLRLPGIELKFLYGYVMSSPIHIQGMAVIEEMELDIIHVHSEFGIGMFARIVAKNLHIPLVSTYHTTYEDYTHYINLFGLKTIDSISRLAVAKMSRMFTKTAQVIVAPSEKTKQMLIGYNIKKEITVIPTGLDLKRFNARNPEAVEKIKNTYNLQGQKVFVYIGRLAKEKSIDVVIDSFAMLLKSGSQAVLLIVGSGPSEEDLKKQVENLGIRESVRFVGRVASHEVVNYYHVSDAFVSASLTETQGLTYIEALACGLCVFARPDEPLEGIILEGKTGYLFDDPAMFAQKAASFIAGDKAYHQQIKANALEMANSFDSQRFAQRMLEVYQHGSDMYYGRYKLIEINETQDGRYEIVLDSKGNRDHIVVDEYILEQGVLNVGDELSRVELNTIEDDQQVYEAYQLALQRIGMKDYTSFEMRTFLHDRLDLQDAQIDNVIDLLIQRRFINDERFFRDKLDYHRDQNRGNNRIMEDLEKRGFTLEQIQEAIDAEDHNDYIQRGIKRADAFLATLREGSQQQRKAKVSQHLLRQGFEYETIKEILGKVEDTYVIQDEYKSLRIVIDKAWSRYEKRYEEIKEIRNRVVKHALSKGYDYDLVKQIMEEKEHES